ncbi:hypothetical protein HJC23_009605 [Cyclotella cryptica]|uniref:K Homology domain-containing protein n=1 Tax=Cyclotella cryptica TaxID=29204 RepID=A0ABD3NW03_9STRA|eukprot:CCRYP_019601-RA/>CCRYP_019601-RA protein AED:0.09 eAED:0.09 QI:0/-1/0/1/-1/1/1/0/309
MIGFGRGGGGGFGGFPYRSAHQQGQDGRGNNRGGRSRGSPRNRQPPSRSRSSHSTFVAAELDIPAEHRRIIVGRGGTTLKWLKEVSGANVFVPHQQLQNRRGLPQQQTDSTRIQQHPVRVNSSDLASVLHAFHEISLLLSTASNIDGDFVPCIVKIKKNDSEQRLDGKLFVQRRNGTDRSQCLFSGSVHSTGSPQQHSDLSAENLSSEESSQLQAYCIETSVVNSENVATIIDNVQFVHSSVQKCRWYHKETLHRNNYFSTNEGDVDDSGVRHLVFVCGSEEESPRLFFDAISEAINAVENNSVSSRLP